VSHKTEPDSGQVPCVNHRKTLTLLQCGRCNDPICHHCLIHAPGGIRCPKCSRREEGVSGRRSLVPIALFGLVGLSVLGFHLATTLGGSDHGNAATATAPPSAVATARSLPTSQPTELAPPPVGSAVITGTRARSEEWEELTFYTLELNVAPSLETVPPPPDSSYAVADVEACAAQGRTERIGPEHFYLETSDNQRLGAVSGSPARRPAFEDAIVSGGDCVRGYLTFEVPVAAELASFNFQMVNPLTGEVRHMRWTPGEQR
jgi:hypothetical protein